MQHGTAQMTRSSMLQLRCLDIFRFLRPVRFLGDIRGQEVVRATSWPPLFNRLSFNGFFKNRVSTRLLTGGLA